MREDLNNYLDGDWLRVLLYGEFASGKSVFSATFPKPVFFFDLDEGYKTYKDMPHVEWKTYKEDTSSKRPTVWREFLSDFQEHYQNPTAKTYVLDSTTTLLDACINDILGVAASGSKATEGLSLPQWGQLVNRFQDIFKKIKLFDAHFVVIGHEQIVQDEVTGAIKTLPMMVGKKFPQRAPIYFDEIYRCYAEHSRGESSFKIQTQPDRRTSARSRFNTVDDYGSLKPILSASEEANFAKMIEKIKKARGD